MTKPAHPKHCKALMLGPMPPAIGGMATVLGNLQQSNLGQHESGKSPDVVFFDTASSTNGNRSIFQAVWLRFKVWKRFVSAVKTEKPECIHIHTCSGLVTSLLDASFALLGRLLGKPYYCHVHGASYDKFLNSLSGIQKLLVFSFLKHAKGVIALTEEWQDIFQTQFHLQNTHVIINGVPDPSYDRQWNNDSIHILYLGQICKRKGVMDLLDACVHIEQSNVHINIVGDFGGDISKAELQDKIEALNIGNKLTLHGPLVGAPKIALMERCQIFCLPSYAEGLPMVVLEAMSYKQAVITTPVGGLPGLLSHNENGMLVPTGSPSELATTIDSLANDYARIETLANRGYERFASVYSIDQVANLYYALYSTP